MWMIRLYVMWMILLYVSLFGLVAAGNSPSVTLFGPKILFIELKVLIFPLKKHSKQTILRPRAKEFVDWAMTEFQVRFIHQDAPWVTLLFL
jgi:hypothetical protein